METVVTAMLKTEVYVYKHTYKDLELWVGRTGTGTVKTTMRFFLEEGTVMAETTKSLLSELVQ